MNELEGVAQGTLPEMVGLGGTDGLLLGVTTLGLGCCTGVQIRAVSVLVA